MSDRRDRSRSRDRKEEERGRDGRERGREQYGQSRYGAYAPPTDTASASSSSVVLDTAVSDDDPGYDDAALKEIEQFLEQDGEEDEEAKLARLAEERRRRREAILQRQAPPSQPQAQPQRAASPLPPADAAVEAEKTKLSGGAVFDMFSATAVDSGPGLLPSTGHALEEEGGEDALLQSNWDDGEGYYRARAGEVIRGDYVSVGVVGKGVFATVLKCLDRRRAPETTDSGGPGAEQSAAVAIKLIRNNDTMRRAADKERAVLLAIAAADPQGRRCCIRLLEHFEHRSHVALVFEFMQGNLRETLKRFGKDVGINVSAVRLYARQLFSALSLLAELRVVHADIKLDNIMCSADLKQVKLCDFGSAFFETDTDNAPTPYLVSRFYRAPEIVLGLQYDRAIDMWSVAVSLYELFTGQVMFPGRSNNEMLRLMMAVKGRLPNKTIKLHQRQFDAMRLEAHFDDDMRFKQAEVDALTGLTTTRLVDVPALPTRDLGPLLRSSKSGADDGRVVGLLADLLDKCLALDSAKRLPVADALKHPFFSLAP